MYYELLRRWCDALVGLQVTEIGRKELYGGIMCPACARLHGRCGDAVYPLMYMADRTGEKRYLEIAKSLFLWAENLARPDGGYINDTNSEWKGITVFAALQLGDALYYHGQLLEAETERLWRKRFSAAVEFLYERIDLLGGNINYPVTCAASLAVAGRLLRDGRYARKARELAHRAMEFIGCDGLLFGEGKPTDGISPKGCRAVDLGYNVEESLPGLAAYALVAEDGYILQKVQKLMEVHLEFMLPDGAWDNSWGTRNYKWTYWGGRTSDGCQNGYGTLARYNPLFEEAAYRNTKLLRDCTHEGLLYGGPMYAAAGEPPCVHHTICHAKALAAMLEQGIEPAGGRRLPREIARGIKTFPSVRVALLARGGWRATFSDCDFEYAREGHATGGAVTLLWHEAAGPLIAATMTEYALIEPNNMQLPRYTKNICLTPRIEYEREGVFYRSINDKKAAVTTDGGEALEVFASGRLTDGDQNGELKFTVRYRLTEEEFSIKVWSEAETALYHLPIISKNTDKIQFVKPSHIRITNSFAIIDVQSDAELKIRGGFENHSPLLEKNEEENKMNRIFNPVGGFEAVPLYSYMGGSGEAFFIISVTPRKDIDNAGEVCKNCLK